MAKVLGMASSAVYLVAFLALIAWRLVCGALQRRLVVEECGTRRLREINFWRGDGIPAIAGEPFDSSRDTGPCESKDRAQTYLGRIAALVGATQTGGTFVIDVGTTRFYVRDRRVKRLRDLVDPTCKFEETCFYVPTDDVPTAEQIATALLELKNNPALFDRWAALIGAVKADGELFIRAR